MALGNPELLLLIAIALLLFGPNKIPQLARSLGKAGTEYKRGIAEAKKAISGDSSSVYTSDELEIIGNAKEMGISTEGRSIEEIASDVINQ